MRVDRAAFDQGHSTSSHAGRANYVGLRFATPTYASLFKLHWLIHWLKRLTTRPVDVIFIKRPRKQTVSQENCIPHRIKWINPSNVRLPTIQYIQRDRACCLYSFFYPIGFPDLYYYRK